MTRLFLLALLSLLGAVPPAAANTLVRLETSLGIVDVELFDTEAPATVANFLDYVGSGTAADGGYDGSFIHRSARTPQNTPFVIQGGGYYFDVDTQFVDAIPTAPPVVNEFGRSNLRGTVAMARVGGQVNSATSQWFVNLTDNSFLDTVDGGFTVFGEVVAGMDVVDAIAALDRWNFGGPLNEVPLIDFDNTVPAAQVAAEFAANQVLINSATVVPEPAVGLLLCAGLALVAARRRQA